MLPESIPALVLFLGILLVACAGGHRILRLLQLSHASAAERLVLATGLGLGCLSLATALAGWLGLLWPVWAWGTLGLVGLVGLSELRSVATALQLPRTAEVWKELTPPARPFAVLLALAVPVYALAALAPPLEGDSLAGYLSVPADYVRASAIHPIDHKWYDDLPLNVQMLTALALLVHSDILAQLVSGFGMGVLSVATLYAICRRWFSATVFFIAAVGYYGLGEVSYANASTKIDLGWAFFELLLLLAFGIWLNGGGDRWLLLSGIFGGLALGSKYTAVYSLVPIGIVLVARTLTGSSFELRQPLPQSHARMTRGIASSLSFFVPLALLGSVWPVKNLVYTGNPFYPLFNEWFGGERLIESVRHSSSLLGLATIWWDMSIGYVTGSFGKPIGPLILVLLPGLLLVRPLPTAVRLLLGYALVVSVVWYFGVQYPRNLLPALAALTLVAGYLFERLTAERALLRRALPILLLVPLSLSLVDYARVNLVSIDRLSYALGLETREAFLARYLGPLYPSWAMTSFVNANLHPDARILALMNGNDYYLRPAFLQSNELAARAVHRAETGEALLAALRKLRVTHVYVNDYVLDLYRQGYGTHAPYQPTLLEQPEFEARHMELLFASGPQRLYRGRWADESQGVP